MPQNVFWQCGEGEGVHPVLSRGGLLLISVCFPSFLSLLAASEATGKVPHWGVLSPLELDLSPHYLLIAAGFTGG